MISLQTPLRYKLRFKKNIKQKKKPLDADGEIEKNRYDHPTSQKKKTERALNKNVLTRRIQQCIGDFQVPRN